jgi:predicted peroxiredoxin
MTDSIRSLAVLLWSADLQHPERVATPFVMAQAAAALDMAVELYFTAQSVQLLTPPAGSVRVGFGPEQRPLSDYLTQVSELGIRLYACGQALHAAGLKADDLIPLCDGLGGSVQFMARNADPSWRTLVF